MLSSARVAIAAIAVALAAPAFAQESAADPEVGSFVCDLSGDCAAPAPEAAATPAPRGARTSSTRGFTFKRTAPTPGGSAAVTASASTPASRPAAGAPATRSANLKLDFASGSSTLMPASRQRLAKLASALSAPQLSGKRMRIEGYTDASGSAAANRELSQKRAQAAADYLVSMGVESARLEVVGYGSSRLLPGVPATSGDNRRVMAVMLN